MPRLPPDPLLRMITIVGGMLAIVATSAAGARAAKSAADRTYVLRDSFALYQREIESTRRADRAAIADSLREVVHILSGLDSSDRCRRKQQNYCR